MGSQHGFAIKRSYKKEMPAQGGHDNAKCPLGGRHDKASRQAI